MTKIFFVGISIWSLSLYKIFIGCCCYEVVGLWYGYQSSHEARDLGKYENILSPPAQLRLLWVILWKFNIADKISASGLMDRFAVEIEVLARRVQFPSALQVHGFCCWLRTKFLWHLDINCVSCKRDPLSLCSVTLLWNYLEWFNKVVTFKHFNKTS